jgi:hypothetical protein
MLNHSRLARRIPALLVGPALLLALGCSDDGLGKRYAVSGTVNYKGQPVSKARISFVPLKGTGPGASGEVVAGKFASLTTLNPGDGVLPGEYKVTVDQREIDEGKVKAATEDLGKKHGMDKVSQIPPELQGKAMREAKSEIPGKYQIAETSDLTAKVDASNTTFSFELKD